MKYHWINDMITHLRKSLPTQHVTENIEKSFQSILARGLDKLNLVTREEFDIQTNVLAKTRAKLEALEAQLRVLEAHEAQHETILDNSPTSPQVLS